MALGQLTHRVVDYQHVTKLDDNCSQRHEMVGCCKMYDKFQDRGTKIANHIHDRNVSINKLVKTKINTRNSNEKWHAAKGITTQIKKITIGKQTNIGKTWHPQLVGKGALLRNHAYWAMDQCNGSAAELRRLIDICLTHFQDNHTHCVPASVCQEEGYVPTYNIIRDPAALNMITKFVHSMVIYKNAEDYVLACSTYYVESFNNTCLIYQDKRIHYGNTMYKLRIQLAILDWNEHVDRPFTSRSQSMRPDHPRNQLGKKAYTRKSYRFVRTIWEMLVAVIQSVDVDVPNEDNVAILQDDMEYDSDNSVDDDQYSDDDGPEDEVYATAEEAAETEVHHEESTPPTYVTPDGLVYLVL
jgi:hypothetical protein